MKTTYDIKNLAAVYNLSVKMLEVRDSLGKSRPINTDEFALAFNVKPKVQKQITPKINDFGVR